MKIICIGQNYKKHIAEMGSKMPEVPVFFMKPDSALLVKNRPFYIPDFTDDLHYEAEIVVRINRVGKTIEERFAHKYYDEIAFGVDLTARDLQRECKKKGLPWEIAKGFEYSAPISEFIPLKKFNSDIHHMPFSITINGEKRQDGNTSDMIFTIDHIISYISKFMTLKIGDMIFTGTPEGVGKLNVGDKIEGFIEDQKLMSMMIR
jgi:acylpyruvate hydrolase